MRAAAVQVPEKAFDGTKTGTRSLSLKQASPESAAGLIHKYLVMVRQNARQGTASTKTRSQVRGGGKKPFQQKGTGRARQGAGSTPLKPGGGIIHGPKPRDYTIKMNKKERRLAMSTALVNVAAAGDAAIVDDLGGQFADGPATRSMNAALNAWGVDENSKALMILRGGKGTVPEAATKSLRNIARLTINRTDMLSVYDILNADTVLFEAGAADEIEALYNEENGTAWKV